MGAAVIHYDLATLSKKAIAGGAVPVKKIETISSIYPSTLVLKGVGKETAKHLASLDIHSVPDLLFHLPLRYQDRTVIQKIAKLRPHQESLVEGVITNVSTPLRTRTKLLCELEDESGSLNLRFFHLSYQKEVFKVGNRVRCFGMVRFGPRGFEIAHPEFQLIEEGKSIPSDEHLTPIYSSTQGVSQTLLRKLTKQALVWMKQTQTLKELLPDHLLKTLAFPNLKEALQFVHQPPKEIALTKLEEMKTSEQKRLVFEELLAHRISLLTAKKVFQSQLSHGLTQSSSLTGNFLKQLPFQLTNAQKRVSEEIANDLKESHPMLRLVQGDVGSGKTVISALAMLKAVENGFQAAMMAPTELLAEQHYRVFKRWFQPLGLNVVFLTSQLQGKTRKENLTAIADGSAHLILGTHALFQEQVQFSRLALVVIDEQHRFGVHQRALFREKGKHADFHPHQLIMTATPIPRTLAMSFYGDLDCSMLDELPPGRKPITTSIIANERRDEIVMRIAKACESGRQAYWVCPLIDESEILSYQAASETSQLLQQCLPQLKIGLIHGRMPAPEKEKTMQAFIKGEIHLLVATTVIEVGVDVANASLMIIENAERLGLSQLHQLRGRVGRGETESHCVLLYQNPLSSLAKERLSVMRETNDGFKIAQRDLELRGPGEILGTRQTGELTFRLADLLRDNDLLPKIQEAADVLMRDYPDTALLLIDRWLGQKSDYGKV